MTWDEAVKRLEGARLNYVAAVWRGSGFDPAIAAELDEAAEALRLLLAHAVPRADRERALTAYADAMLDLRAAAHDCDFGGITVTEYAAVEADCNKRMAEARRLLKLDEEGPDA